MEYDAVMSDDHGRLVAEMPAVQRLPISERLLLARRRRLEQVIRYEQRLNRHTTTSARCSTRRRQYVQFTTAVSLLDTVRRHDVNEVRELLKSSPYGTVNTRSADGLTPLHQACIYGSVEMVEMLLYEFSADVNRRDDDHWTPLHSVALCGHTRVAQCLVDCGADVLALNSDGNMPYDLCDDEATLDVIESAMAKQGVTQEKINKLRAADEQKMLRDLKRLYRKGHDLEFRGQHGETPLHVAACNGYVIVGEFLLGRKFNVNTVDNDLWTATHYAALWRQVTMLELLVGHGADLSAASSDGRTPSDVCGDAAVRDWLLRLQTTMTSPNCHHSLPPNAVIEPNTRADGSRASLYNSNLSLADKTTLTSTSKCRLESASRKESSDEAHLWTSLQSVADDTDLLDAMSQSVRLVPPAQFRRPSSPAIDEQLQMIVDDLRHDSRLQPSTRGHQQAVTDDTTSRKTDDGDSKNKSCAKDRRRTDSETSSVDGANWQLKSTVSSAVSSEGRKKAMKQCNGHVATSGVVDEHARTGQTSDEVKKCRSAQRHGHSVTASHSSCTDKKPVNTITTFHHSRNSIRRCAVM